MKYEGMAQERITNLGPYLHKACGKSTFQWLSVEMQMLIHECTSDEEKGRSLMKLDRELDDIFQTGHDLDYVDISLTTKEDIRPSDAVESNTFIL